MKKYLTLIIIYIIFSCTPPLEIKEIKGITLKAPKPENIEMFLNFVTDVLDPDEINTIIFRIGWNYEFSSYPELIDEDALSKSDVRKIVKHCNSLGIQVIPQINLLGHQSTLIRDQNGIAVKTKMRPLLANYPEFDETPEIELPENYQWPNKDGLYTKSYCPLHPDVHEIVLDIVDDLINAFGSNYFHAGMDEVFYIGNDNCPRCSGKSKAKLFADEVNLVNSFLKENNVELMIWGDRMIDGFETGLGMWEASENNTHGSVDLIDKDVIITDWHYRTVTNTHDYFIKKGYRVITCPYNVTDVAIANYENYKKYDSDLYLGLLQTIRMPTEDFIDLYYDRPIDVFEGRRRSLDTYKKLVSLWKSE